MNLIEQLGGYKNAKERLKRENALTDSDYNYGQKKLLKYRRQHNIYEVGEDVKIRCHRCGKLKEPSQFRKLKPVWCTWCINCENTPIGVIAK